MTIRSKESALVSLVILFQRTDGVAQVVFNAKALEAAMNTAVELGQVFTEAGPALLMRVPRLSVEAVIAPEKLEVNYIGAAKKSCVPDVVDTCLKILPLLPLKPAKLIGYNFVYLVDTGETAIQAIADRTHMHQALSEVVKHDVLGASLGVWLKVDERILWLRLEPRGGDQEAKWVRVYANFTETTDGSLPSRETLAQNLASCHVSLQKLMKKLRLW